MEEHRAPARNNKARILLLVPIIAINLWGGIHAVNAATSHQGALFDFSNNSAVLEKGTASGGAVPETSVSSTVNRLVLSTSSATFIYNGQPVKAAQPMAYRRGYYYVPVITMAELFGLNLTYDSRTKETIVSDKNMKVHFRAGSRAYTANGSTNMMEAHTFTQQGTLMIPLSSWADMTGSTLVKEGKSLSLTWR
ncbi:stalk domain-containing protein [Paenibacillus sp. GCM10028914]|uniref:stalk domain-containing protein n=1 Tax=Paenibacillus sp. GCM10028914 TaxID=3273416 RepID=UPI0036157DB4